MAPRFSKTLSEEGNIAVLATKEQSDIPRQFLQPARHVLRESPIVEVSRPRRTILYISLQYSSQCVSIIQHTNGLGLLHNTYHLHHLSHIP